LYSLIEGNPGAIMAAEVLLFYLNKNINGQPRELNPTYGQVLPIAALLGIKQIK